MNAMKLPSGMRYGHDANGKRVCVGAMMGRRDQLPQVRSAPGKLRLVRLRWCDGDYDEGGAYWGGGRGDFVYWAKGDLEGEEFTTEVFVRARSRDGAKKLIRESVGLVNVRFYR